jgi:hypothetical protein
MLGPLPKGERRLALGPVPSLGENGLSGCLVPDGDGAPIDPPDVGRDM